MCPSQQGKTSKNGSDRGRFSSLSYHSYHAAKAAEKGSRGLPNYLYFASMRSR